MSDAGLIAAARDVMTRAYAPYSKFHVGAALETAEGEVFVGCNMENASYGVTICAERTALGAAVSAGARSFRRIAIVSSGDTPAPPCGACRQALAEFGVDLEVIAASPDAEQRWLLRELLPDPFTPGRLSQDVV